MKTFMIVIYFLVSDIFKKMNVFFQPTHYVNKIIEIPLESIVCDSSNVEIPVPTAHVGIKALPVRLISAVKRQGMVSCETKFWTKRAQKKNIRNCWLIVYR